jgi:DNA-binding response OmpR family regulator
MADGAAAVRRAPARVGVTEINHSGTNGLDVLKKLRQNSQVPVIMRTAMDREADKVHALEAGADD